MTVPSLAVIATLLIAVVGVVVFVVTTGDGDPSDPEAGGRDFFAVEEEYPTTGGQEMRPQF